jgi:chromosome segregation ATPase
METRRCFKKKQDNLKTLENTPENSNDPTHQKKIEIAKKQIAKSQDKLNEAKKDVESGLKKVENLEKKIQEAKFTRQE